jgi:hypothetical protein
MQSLSVVFTGLDEVHIRQEPVPELGSRDVLVQACKTLVSPGSHHVTAGVNRERAERVLKSGVHSSDGPIHQRDHPMGSSSGTGRAKRRVISIGLVPSLAD